MSHPPRMAVSPQNVAAAREIYALLPEWQLARDSIAWLFHHQPGNIDPLIVGAKIGVVEGYFGTGLFQRRMRLALRDHIVRLAQEGLDAQFARGDLGAAERIEKLRGRYETSFASKYAHFHNVTAFPIFDSHADRALRWVTGWQFVSGYRNWCEALKEWRVTSPELKSAQLVDLDRYLWLYGMRLAAKAGKPINAEVRDFFATERGRELAKQLDPSL